MARQLVGLGQAFELRFIRNGSNREEVVSFPGYWWAWEGDYNTGNIRLVQPIALARVKPTGRNVALFERFHGSPPDTMVLVDAEPMRRPFDSFATATAIGYDAEGMDSNKAAHRYRHYFGAFDHGDRPPFPESSRPEVVLDADNQLVLKRRPSNTFRLEEWITG